MGTAIPWPCGWPSQAPSKVKIERAFNARWTGKALCFVFLSGKNIFDLQYFLWATEWWFSSKSNIYTVSKTPALSRALPFLLVVKTSEFTQPITAWAGKKEQKKGTLENCWDNKEFFWCSGQPSVCPTCLSHALPRARSCQLRLGSLLRPDVEGFRSSRRKPWLHEAFCDVRSPSKSRSRLVQMAPSLPGDAFGCCTSFSCSNIYFCSLKRSLSFCN